MPSVSQGGGGVCARVWQFSGPPPLLVRASSHDEHAPAEEHADAQVRQPAELQGVQAV